MRKLNLLNVILISLFFVRVFSLSALATESSLESVPQGSAVKEVASDGALKNFANGVHRFVLPNGLRVLFYRRAQVPVFAGQVWVKVGGVDEKLGKTGAAHMLEHMAFKGSERIGTKNYNVEKILLLEQEEIVHKLLQIENSLPAKEEQKKVSQIESNKEQNRYNTKIEKIESKEIESKEKDSKDLLMRRLGEIEQELSTLWVENEFSKIYQTRGAVGLNAGTAKDYTMYQVRLPSVEFELWCWMESERLLNPVFRQFYKERDVVLEERRMRSEVDPGGQVYEALLATAYWAHPNRLPVIGWSSDLKRLTATDVERLHRRYYRPDNIVLVLVGDLELGKVKEGVARYFGRLPQGKRALPQIVTVEPTQNGERESTVIYDAQPMMVVAFHKPVYPDPDDLHFAMLHTLLSSGRSSILYRELVLGKQLAKNIETSEAPGDRFPSLFFVSAEPRSGVSNERLRDEIQLILDRLKEQLIGEKDFQAAKKQLLTGFLHELDDNEGIAESLAHNELIYGGWERIIEAYEGLQRVTREDISHLAKRYLNVENRSYIHLERKK